MSGSQSSKPFGVFSPEIFTSFWKAFGSVAVTAEPALRNATRINLEIAGLAGNRARAYMDIPATLAKCRSPQELISAQMQFWQAANREYAATAQRIGEAMQVGLRAGRSDPADAAMRDFITFPEVVRPEAQPQAPAGTTSPRRPSDRRVAA